MHLFIDQIRDIDRKIVHLKKFGWNSSIDTDIGLCHSWTKRNKPLLELQMSSKVAYDAIMASSFSVVSCGPRVTWLFSEQSSMQVKAWDHDPQTHIQQGHYIGHDLLVICCIIATCIYLIMVVRWLVDYSSQRWMKILRLNHKLCCCLSLTLERYLLHFIGGNNLEAAFQFATQMKILYHYNQSEALT